MSCIDAEQLTVLSSVIAAEISRGLTAEETNILAALLSAVANNLALIAAMEQGSLSSKESQEKQQPSGSGQNQSGAIKFFPFK
ncbi:MAG: hypothetical protein GX424_02200 [Clostridiales bacterium]|jgi:hypothetical protein|nr:hypothetical protein [Clostridiales bacterium]